MELDRLTKQIAKATRRSAELSLRAEELRLPNDAVLAQTVAELQGTLEELHVAEQELHAQNDELEASQAALEAERARYRDLFAQAPIGYLTTTLHGAITEVNLAASQMLGVRLEFAHRKPLTMFLAPTDRAEFRTRLARLARGEQLERFSVLARPHRGIPFDASFSATVITDHRGQPSGLRWVMHDVTEWRAVEERWRALNEELQRQVGERTSQLARAASTAEELLRREHTARLAGERARQRLGRLATVGLALDQAGDVRARCVVLAKALTAEAAGWASVSLVVEDSLRHSCSSSAAGAADLTSAFAGEPSSSTAASTLAARAIRAGAEQELSLRTESGLAELTGAHVLASAVCSAGARAALAIPLVARGRTLGVVMCYVREPHDRFDPDDRELLLAMARRGAVSIDNARLHEQLEREDQAKSNFLAVLSHELRTPLNAVVGYAELILMGLPEVSAEASVRHAERIRSASMHLLDIIEQILFFSRAESGNEQLQIERVNARDLVSLAGALAEPLATAKGLAFVVTMGPELPILSTDPSKVRQILLNLIGNAVKFTERGSVTLNVRCENDQLAFEVRDTGIGIAPEFLDRVFDPFWQAPRGLSGVGGGTGLGLSVSRRLARLLGGDVSVHSVLGEGSVFTLRLPLLSMEPADAHAGR